MKKKRQKFVILVGLPVLLFFSQMRIKFQSCYEGKVCAQTHRQTNRDNSNNSLEVAFNWKRGKCMRNLLIASHMWSHRFAISVWLTSCFLCSLTMFDLLLTLIIQFRYFSVVVRCRLHVWTTKLLLISDLTISKETRQCEGKLIRKKRLFSAKVKEFP